MNTSVKCICSGLTSRSRLPPSDSTARFCSAAIAERAESVSSMAVKSRTWRKISRDRAAANVRDGARGVQLIHVPHPDRVSIGAVDAPASTRERV
jgi:hypothetical protein